MYSQRDEEKWILEFFNKYVGRFLDIGAYDGKTFSTTRALAEKGWGGVLVDPEPAVQKSLQQLYGGQHKYRIMPIGVGVKSGLLPFYSFYGDAIGSFDFAHAELWRCEKKARHWKEIKLPVLSVEEFFKDVGYEFDFLNLDIEGWSVEVLAEIDFQSWPRLKMICVEFDKQKKIVLTLTQDFGFKLLHQTAENLILVR
jgi:FkbM family methyltransferase